MQHGERCSFFEKSADDKRVASPHDECARDEEARQIDNRNSYLFPPNLREPALVGSPRLTGPVVMAREEGTGTFIVLPWLTASWVRNTDAYNEALYQNQDLTVGFVL